MKIDNVKLLLLIVFILVVGNGVSAKEVTNNIAYVSVGDVPVDTMKQVAENS